MKEFNFIIHKLKKKGFDSFEGSINNDDSYYIKFFRKDEGFEFIQINYDQENKINILAFINGQKEERKFLKTFDLINFINEEI